MNNNGKNRDKVIPPSNEVNLARVFQVLNRRKYLIITFTVLFLILAIVYNTFAPEVFESTVLLKKEKSTKTQSNDELSEIISLQTADELETELEIIKTNEVLQKTIDELKLNLFIDKVAGPEEVYNVKSKYLDYQNSYLDQSSKRASELPQFMELKPKKSNKALEYYIRKAEGDKFELYNSANDSLIAESKDPSAAVFNIADVDLGVYWPHAVEGSKVFFNIDGTLNAIEKLKKAITIERKSKSDVFAISVSSSTPYAAQLITATLTDNYRASRIDQQKQTIRYSFEFVDENLEEIQTKLQEAESELSQFKSANKIMDLDGSSEDLVRFISNLETEKLNTELMLNDYKSKHEQMKKELDNSGYFDQTFLTPQGNDPTNSPFQTMLRQLNDLQLQRLELLQKRTESHPEVVRIDEQIEQLEKNLSNSNVNTLTSYNIIINSLEKKMRNLGALTNKYEQKMQLMPTQENKLAGLVRQKNVYAKMYTLLLDKREEMRIAELSKLQDIVIVDPARIPKEPISPKKQFNIAAGIFGGLFFGMMALVIAEYRGKKKIILDDVERDYDFPILAIIPNYSKELEKRIDTAIEYEDRFVTLMEDEDGFKESFRVLRTKLSSEFELKKKIMMFTSCEENTGKTSTVANLAISIAKSKKKVLIIDCDLRKGTLSSLFDISDDAPGLIQYLKNEIDAPYIYNKAVKTLDILPSGGVDEESADLLGSDKMQSLLSMINTSQYDYILFDTPPVTRVVDTLILGKIIKKSVLILRPEHTFKDSVAWGLQEMEQAKIDVVGSVINAAVIEKSSFRYRYGYGYGYKYGYGRENFKDNKHGGNGFKPASAVAAK